MKKILALMCVLAMISGCTACAEKDGDSAVNVSSAEVTTEAELSAELVNKMSQSELERVDKHALTLLDEPDNDTHKVELQQKKVPLDEYREQYLEPYRGQISDEEYQHVLDEIQKLEDKGETEIAASVMVFIDGCLYLGLIPDDDYDGGEISYQVSRLSDDYDGVSEITDDDVVWEQKTAANPEEYFEQYRASLEAEGYSTSADIDSRVRQARIVFDAFINRTYTEVPDGTYVLNTESEGLDPLFSDPLADYRKNWECDRAEVEAIKDCIDEYSFYDAELDTEFLVHVVLPPNYSKDKPCPVLFLTDAVWRFGDTPALRKAMEDGEAADVILVTLGYGYKTDGSNEAKRFNDLVIERDKLLDFITDNVMPYLGEQYRINYADSTLFGHSDGGVFAHNALFKSDEYENQPFGRYIIGSPAFWGLYDCDFDLDADGCISDYGYFERNDKLNKTVFICGGNLEDPDYEDMYRGHDSTLEGLEKLHERLKTHGADVTCKMYDSHHYQYIPEMLLEYLKMTYPA